MTRAPRFGGVQRHPARHTNGAGKRSDLDRYRRHVGAAYAQPSGARGARHRILRSGKAVAQTVHRVGPLRARWRSTGLGAPQRPDQGHPSARPQGASCDDQSSRRRCQAWRRGSIHRGRLKAVHLQIGRLYPTHRAFGPPSGKGASHAPRSHLTRSPLFLRSVGACGLRVSPWPGGPGIPLYAPRLTD